MKNGSLKGHCLVVYFPSFIFRRLYYRVVFVHLQCVAPQVCPPGFFPGILFFLGNPLFLPAAGTLDYFFIVYRLHIRIPHDFLMKNEWSQSLVEMAHFFGSIGALDYFFIFHRLHIQILRNFLIQNEWLRSKSDLMSAFF